MLDNDNTIVRPSENIPEANSLAGYFNIEKQEDGLYLTVFPPQDQASPAVVSDVITKLRNHGFTRFDNTLVLATVQEAKGIPINIMPFETPEVTIEVSKDGLEARIHIANPENCKPVTRQCIEEAITKAKIRTGIDPLVFDKITQDPRRTYTLAKGCAPINGQDAQIIYHVQPDTSGKPVEMENGRVDFKNLNMFTCVNKGDILAEKVAFTNGTPGADVYGNVLGAKPGKDAQLPLGKNVALVPGTLQVEASVTGQLTMVDKKISVSPVLEIRSDVDFSTGNIAFVGNVSITGNVQPGFSVKAEGDIEISGTVSGAIIEGVNITIRGGINGLHQGYVHAKEKLSAKFIENAHVSAGTDVIVTNEAIMHSKVFAGKRVVSEGKRGLIVGGMITAGEEIRSKTIGSPAATPTELGVGVNPGLREEYAKMNKELKASETTLDQAKKSITVLKNMDQNKLSPEKKQMLLQLTKSSYHLIGQVERLRNRLMEIELSLEDMRFGKVMASENVHPGVKITIGSLTKPIRDTLKFVTFYSEEGEIKIGPFK